MTGSIVVTSWHSKTGGFAEVLIDCEEDRVLGAVLVGMLR